MATAVPDLVKLRNQIADVYYELTPLEQLMVQLFSVIYAPVSRTSFVECLNKTGARHPNGNWFTAPTIKPYIDRLLELEVLVQEPGVGPQCHPLLVEIATRDAVRVGRFESLVGAVERVLPISSRGKNGPRYFSNNLQLIREVRIGLYRRDMDFVNHQFADYYNQSNLKEPIAIADVLEQVCNNPFDPDWLKTLPGDLLSSILTVLLDQFLIKLTPAHQAIALAQELCAQPQTQPEALQIPLVEHLLLQGKVSEAQRLLQGCPAPQSHSEVLDTLRGWIKFLQGDYEGAIQDYTIALQTLKKYTGKRKVFFKTIDGPFFLLALLKQGSPEQLKEATLYASIGRQARHWLSSTYALLEALLQIQQGDLSGQETISVAAALPATHGLEALFRYLCFYWVDRDRAKTRLGKPLEAFYQQAKTAGYDWLAMEAAELLSRIEPRSPYGEEALTWRQTCGIHTLVDLIQFQEPWELSLNALAQLQSETKQPAPSQKSQRLAWFITYYPQGCHLQPREQSITAKGEWGKGRNIALKRLVRNLEEFTYFTPQDLRVCAHLKSYTYGYYNDVEHSFDEQAIVELIGHPLVFWEDAPTTRIEIVKGEPELLVSKGKGDQIVLQLLPQLQQKQPLLVIKETPTRLKVIEITPEHRRIAEILGPRNRLQVPAVAKERVLAAIHAVAGIVTVHSDIGGGSTTATSVTAQAQPHVHLLPNGAGLKVAILVRPFGEAGPYFRPGQGGEMVLAEIQGERLQTTRNLGQEKQLANSAIAACPTLSNQADVDGEWLLDDPQDCLELLLQLQTLGEQVVVEWPEGEKLRVTRQVGLQDLRLKIQQKNDWFATTGEIQVDGNLVVDMQQLLELLAQSPGAFVPLGDGQFLALTQEFRKRLEELRAFSEKSGKGLRIHPLAGLALADWVGEVGQLQADQHWRSHIERLQSLEHLQPELPSTLQADLRDYQIDGFCWLARLAHWGVGACLADDMGLGKTLQALAVILTRAPAGPTLVVAPTSVGMNWISEAQRFAPTLNLIQFGSGDRQKLLDQLQPLDLLVCSYGLLQQEEVAEMLARVEWQTIVLDEAQSIKNVATKRSQAAMNLQGGFKLITTGTPIENHLGELWNLFRFINPGLLGSLESFNQRFATPIEKYGDRAARTRLKKLIQPFILRRTKNQVLAELPSRTEIILHVDLSQEEMAFYEALRQQALTKLSESDATAGAKHLQVLAEIMKLRRACCNARLVMPDTPLPSAKLQLFGEVLEELLANQHKALVFSQFVDHLQLIRAYLEEQKITYQYLDGSTPAAERKKRVDAFQAGQGDVFLISLKAGGTGLNLTAADYVIHMDPWWNPAVEDQASDRAHRIGQNRPVTIYRLVAKHTIEEKIVDLHQHKRDLADSLLDGTDISGKISTDELLRLISNGSA